MSVEQLHLQQKEALNVLSTFVDEYSRYAVIEFMKSKSQVLEKFIERKNSDENLYGSRIISLKSVNGKEYINKEFDDFLKQNGISRQLTFSRTSQQNDISEKMNYTLFDITRRLHLLRDSDVLKEL